MCGRYASSRTKPQLLEEFHISADAPSDDAHEPDYNIAPTKQVNAVLERQPKDAHDSPPAVRQLRVLQWGLVPSWAKDPKIGARMINARAETVHEKPAYRKPFATRRCLLPADGFFEWYTHEVKADGKPVKQPFFITPRDGSTLAMAGLYEFWRNREVPSDDSQAWLITCTIITTQATDDIGHIHDRMPMTIHPDRWTDWLNPELTDTHTVRELLTPASQQQLDVYPVPKAVNNVRNNGPQLLEPLPAEQ